jgi:hypothetical protein
VCDISYVPKNIYDKISFIELDGIRYTHPSFIYIDFYRIITDPYFSGSFRWKKIFVRLYKLQKYYPFNKATKSLNSAYDIPAEKAKMVTMIHKNLYDQIKNKSNFIVFGQYAYNVLLEKSGILKDSVLSKKYKIINDPFLQVVSTNYIYDAASLIVKLKNDFKNISDKITYSEFYPFWMFTGYSTVIYYENFPILHITSNNNRCIPTKTVQSELYTNNKVEKDDNSKIQIGSFDFILLMNLISGLRAKVNSLDKKFQYHNIMTSQLVEMRNYYFQKNKKTLLDETLFQTFIPDCTGPAVDPAREMRLIREKKYKEGKLVIFRYNPEEPREPPDYKFANTSGNEINKSRNLKITKYVLDPTELQKLNNTSPEENIVSNI